MFTAILTTLLLAAATESRSTSLPRPSPTPEPLTFASDVRMIRLDVSVVDKGGRPVRGLSAGDFSIWESGKAVQLSVFEAMEDGALATSALGEDGSAMSLTVRAPFGNERRAGQRIVIVGDPSGLGPKQLARMREGMAGFITSQAKDGDIVRLINLATREAWEGRIPEERFRLAALGRTLAQRRNPLFRGRGDDSTIAEQFDNGAESDVRAAFSESQRSERFLSQFSRTNELLSLFDEILIQLAAVPGRKSLIFISSGFPEMRTLGKRLEKTAHLAREAQASIHFIDAFGLDDLVPEEPGQRLVNLWGSAWERSGGSQDLAEATGGLVSRFANALTEAVSRAAEEARSYYIVGYVPLRGDDGRFRTVKVRVNRSDVAVRTKKGYIAGGFEKGLDTKRVH